MTSMVYRAIWDQSSHVQNLMWSSAIWDRSIHVLNLLTSMVMSAFPGPCRSLGRYARGNCSVILVSECCVFESVSESADLVPESAVLVSEPRCSFRISPLSFRISRSTCRISRSSF